MKRSFDKAFLSGRDRSRPDHRRPKEDSKATEFRSNRPSGQWSDYEPEMKRLLDRRKGEALNSPETNEAVRRILPLLRISARRMLAGLLAVNLLVAVDEAIAKWLLAISRGTRFDPTGRASSFGFGILLRVCQKVAREERRLAARSSDTERISSQDSTGDLVEREEARRQVRRALMRLSIRHRRALLEKYLFRLKARDSAARNGRSERAEESLRQRALREFEHRWRRPKLHE